MKIIIKSLSSIESNRGSLSQGMRLYIYSVISVKFTIISVRLDRMLFNLRLNLSILIKCTEYSNVSKVFFLKVIQKRRKLKIGDI